MTAFAPDRRVYREVAATVDGVPSSALPSLAEAIERRAAEVVDTAAEPLAFVAYLDNMGEGARDIATHAAAAIGAHEDEAAWLWEGERWLRFLAAAAWLAEVGPRLDREAVRRAQLHAPMLPLRTARDIAAAGRGAIVLDGDLRGMVRDAPAGDRWVRDVASLDAGLARHLASLPVLRKLIARRLVLWAIARCHDNDAKGLPEPCRVEVPGGFAALAGLLGYRDRDQRKDVAHALWAFRFVPLTWGTPNGMVGHGNLLERVEEYRAAPGRPARLILRWSPALAPAAHRLPPEGHAGRELVPALPVPEGVATLPGPVRPAAALLDAWLTIEWRLRAAEVASTGTFAADADDLADRAGVRRADLPKVLRALAERWQRRTSGQWAMVGASDEERLAADRVTIEGRKMLGGRKAAEVGSRRREARLTRTGRGKNGGG